MTTKLGKTTLLSEDILRIANNLTSEKLDLNTLCRDYSNSAVLTDKNPVLNISRDDLVGVFDYGINHYCLAPGQVLRFGEFCSLNLPQMISLMIKAEWESLISTVLRYSFSDPQLNLATALRNKEFTDKYIRDFRPDTGKFFTLVRDTARTSEEITYSLIDFLINEFLADEIFLGDIGQNGIHYSDSENNELIMLSEASESQRIEYHNLKLKWTEKSAELEDYLQSLENRKRENLNAVNRYMEIFGESEIKRTELNYLVNKLTLALMILKEKPGLTYTEVLKSAEERLVSYKTEIDELRKNIARSHNCINADDFGIPVTHITKELQIKYDKEVSSLIKKIWKLCHPDVSPRYKNLSDEKKEEMKELWHRTMSSLENEKHSYKPNMLLFHRPNLKNLESIFLKLCKMLNVDPEHYEVGNRLKFMISTGASIAEVIEFLKYDIGILNLQLTDLELRQDEYTNEIQAQKYRTATNNISRNTDKLNKEISELEIRLQTLENEIANEFKDTRI